MRQPRRRRNPRISEPNGQAAFRPRLLPTFAPLTVSAATDAEAQVSQEPLRWPSRMLLAKFQRAAA